jgi:predicted glutamine amidotransferase
MCRLFGQHAPPELDRCVPLCSAHNALRFQSHKHPHGWGIAWYEAGRVRVERGLLPAHADEAFVEAARAARSRVVIAHVRDASIGPVTEANTHPFVHGQWIFAHNGTVARFKDVARVRAQLEAEVDPGLRRALRGETDSERCFLIFLTRLAARGSTARVTLAEVKQALRATTQTVRRIADQHSSRRSSLNFLVTDGRVLAASRLGRDLHVAVAAGVEHVFAVASEPIGDAAWKVVPEGAVVGYEGPS